MKNLFHKLPLLILLVFYLFSCSNKEDNRENLYRYNQEIVRIQLEALGQFEEFFNLLENKKEEDELKKWVSNWQKDNLTLQKAARKIDPIDEEDLMRKTLFQFLEIHQLIIENEVAEMIKILIQIYTSEDDKKTETFIQHIQSLAGKIDEKHEKANNNLITAQEEFIKKYELELVEETD